MIWTTRPRSEAQGLRAIRQGSGAQVLLLHGVGLRAEAWNAQTDVLATHAISVIAPDMLGHGDSAPLPEADTDNTGTDTLAAYTAPLATVLTKPTVVVGHSMGAMMALKLASDHPDQVCGVVAMNAIYRRDPAAQTAVLARASALDGQLRSDPTSTLARWFGTKRSPARAACESWLRDVDPAAYKAAYTVFAQSDGPSDAALETLHCPALFLTGSEEPNSTPAMSNAMAERAPLGRAMVVDGAAHMMPMTHVNAVNQTLMDFVQECHQ